MINKNVKAGVDLARKHVDALVKRFILAKGRSSFAWGWRKARKLHIERYPHCFACGHIPRKRSNDVHHIIPRHVSPGLVGVSANLITLCRKNHCHIIFGHFGDYRRRYNPDIVQLVGSLGARMIDAKAAFVKMQEMSPEARLALLQGFAPRVKKALRKNMPALPPLDKSIPDSVADLHGDLIALRDGRTMDKSRLARLKKYKLIVRRTDIAPGAVALTKKGDRFMKTPTEGNLPRGLS